MPKNISCRSPHSNGWRLPERSLQLDRHCRLRRSPHSNGWRLPDRKISTAISLPILVAVLTQMDGDSQLEAELMAIEQARSQSSLKWMATPRSYRQLNAELVLSQSSLKWMATPRKYIYLIRFSVIRSQSSLKWMATPRTKSPIKWGYQTMSQSSLKWMATPRSRQPIKERLFGLVAVLTQMDGDSQL